MTANSPKSVALKSSAFITVIVAAFIVVGALIFKNNIPFWEIFIFISLTFIVVYRIISWAIEKFIYQKVKIIYKTIHRLKRTDAKEELDMNDDVLEEARKDVMNWADERVKEIQDLRDQDTFRRDFIGNLSHELKTPVFNIQGYILTLLDGALEDEENNRRFLGKAAKSADRMVTLLEDLDTITRIESGALEFEKAPFDIVELAREVIDSLEHKAKKIDISLRLKNPNERAILVVADKLRIEQVLTNLLTNSIKYGEEHGETLIRFYDMEENILVEVADNGIGMTERHLPRVFERFYRVDKSRSRHHGGSGLGLAIVKHIIEVHEQTINVRSSKGVGSTFSFTLEKH